MTSEESQFTQHAGRREGINRIARHLAPNRWALFTDDELHGLQIWMPPAGEYGSLRTEIDAELERRKP